MSVQYTVCIVNVSLLKEKTKKEIKIELKVIHSFSLSCAKYKKYIFGLKKIKSKGPTNWVCYHSLISVHLFIVTVT